MNKVLSMLKGILQELKQAAAQDSIGQEGTSPAYHIAIQVEFELSIIELQTIYDMHSNDKNSQALEISLRAFFATRWDRIRNTTAAYVEFHYHPLNFSSQSLAIAIAHDNESIAQILMPTLEITYYAVIEESLIKVTEYEDRTLALKEFIVSHDGKSIIPLQGWINQQEYVRAANTQKYDNPYLFHLFKKDSQGAIQILEPEKYFHPTPYIDSIDQRIAYQKYVFTFKSINLHPSDINNLRPAAGGEHTNAYINAVNERILATQSELYQEIIQFCDRCVECGAPPRGKGTYEAPHENFKQYFDEFMRVTWPKILRNKDTLFGATTGEKTFKEYIYKIIWGVNPSLLNRNEIQDVVNSQTPDCIQEISDQIRIILGRRVEFILGREQSLPPFKPLLDNINRALKATSIIFNSIRYASQEKQFSEKIIELLIKHEKIVLTYDSLVFCFEHGTLEQFECIAKRNLILKDGRTALSIAVQLQNLKLIKALVKAGADLNERLINPVLNASHGHTLFHLAIVYQWQDIVETCLLKHGQFNIEIANNGGWTALHYAAEFATADTLKKILAVYNKNKINEKTQKKHSALDIAAQTKKTDNVKALIEAGVDISPEAFPDQESYQNFYENFILRPLKINRENCLTVTPPPVDKEFWYRDKAALKRVYGDDFEGEPHYDQISDYNAELNTVCNMLRKIDKELQASSCIANLNRFEQNVIYRNYPYDTLPEKEFKWLKIHLEIITNHIVLNKDKKLLVDLMKQIALCSGGVTDLLRSIANNFSSSHGIFEVLSTFRERIADSMAEIHLKNNKNLIREGIEIHLRIFFKNLAERYGIPIKNSPIAPGDITDTKQRFYDGHPVYIKEGQNGFYLEAPKLNDQLSDMALVNYPFDQFLDQFYAIYARDIVNYLADHLQTVIIMLYQSAIEAKKSNAGNESPINITLSNLASGYFITDLSPHFLIDASNIDPKTGHAHLVHDKELRYWSKVMAAHVLEGTHLQITKRYNRESLGCSPEVNLVNVKDFYYFESEGKLLHPADVVAQVFENDVNKKLLSQIKAHNPFFYISLIVALEEAKECCTTDSDFTDPDILFLTMQFGTLTQLKKLLDSESIQKTIHTPNSNVKKVLALAFEDYESVRKKAKNTRDLASSFSHEDLDKIALLMENDTSHSKTQWDSLWVIAKEKQHPALLAALIKISASKNILLEYTIKSLKEGWDNVAIACLNSPKINFKFEDQQGWSYLHFAAAHARIEALKILLQPKKAYPVNKKTKEGFTALYLAVKFGHAGVTQLLLAHPQIKPSVEEKNNEGKTLVETVISSNRLDILTLLVNADAPFSGQALLSRAIENKHHALIHALVKKGLYAPSVMHLALEDGTKNWIKLAYDCLKIENIDLDTPNKEGKTPLKLAIEKGQIDLAVQILSKSKNIQINVARVVCSLYSGEFFEADTSVLKEHINTTILRITPLQYALDNERISIAMDLILAGADHSTVRLANNKPFILYLAEQKISGSAFLKLFESTPSMTLNNLSSQDKKTLYHFLAKHNLDKTYFTSKADNLNNFRILALHDFNFVNPDWSNPVATLLAHPNLDRIYKSYDHINLCNLAGIHPNSSNALKLYAQAYVCHKRTQGYVDNHIKLGKINQGIQDPQKESSNKTILSGLHMHTNKSYNPFKTIKESKSFRELPEPLRMRFFS